MALRLIRQGRRGTSATAGEDFEGLGSNGLGVCVGVAVANADGGWAIAHIDCEIAVPTQEAFNQVRDATATKMTDWLGARDGRATTIMSAGGKDRSTQAIYAGIAQWYGDGAPPLQGWVGFSIPPGGVPQSLNSHDENNWDGDGAFSVP